MKQPPTRIHPAVWDAQAKLRAGGLSRREFLRLATLLGVSFSSANVLAACGSTEAPVAEPMAEPEVVIEPSPAVPAIKRGGTWTASMQLQLLDHPARLSWVEGANIVRQMSEYLTETGPNNITRPLLLERWEASDDVQTWDLFLKQGVRFNNGDTMTADDVLFTIGQWLDPDVGSSMLGLLSSLGSIDNVEKVDDYHIRLNLESPDIAIPESLFHYPAVILHRDFEGDIVKQPVGTGPFQLVEYAEGERARFVRREDYWRMGEDEEPLPYLDELIFVSTDKDAGVAGLQSGQVDTMYDPRPSDYLALKDVPGLSVRPASTAQCLVLRMRVDQAPWDDNRVRTALKMCQDREKILQLAYFGEGVESIDAHFAPAHPAYCEQPIPAYDPDGARALLEEYAAEQNIELPLQVTLATKNDQAEPEIAQVLRELAEPAGFEIELDITEPDGYWERWTEVDLGITSWTHRPLGTMVPALAYTEESIGEWNETRWFDEEFAELLSQAQSTLDVEARREIFCQMETIMQERGPIGNPFWKNVWNITREEFQNVEAHPTAYFLMSRVWKDV